jgi:hypothetical protein
MTTPDYEISQTSVATTMAAGDYVPFLKTLDTTTPPAGAHGSNQRVTMATLAATMVSLFGMQRAYDVVIAPSNASAQFKAASDVVLTGTGDQAAINTALAGLPGVGRVLIGPGTVSIADKIILDQAGCELHACGDSTYIQASASFNASAAALLHVGTAAVLSGCVVSDLQLDGNYGTASGTAVGLLASAAAFRVARVEVKNTTGDGYYFQAFDGSTLIDEIFMQDCYAYQPAGKGVHIGTTVENSEFHRVFSVGSTQLGSPYGSDGFTVEGNNCKFLQCHPYFNVGDGMAVAAGCGNHRIIDGEYETNGGAGISLGDGTYHMAIIGPIFYANGGKQIAANGFGDAQDLVIAGCSVFGLGSAAGADKAFYIAGTSGVSVTGNTFDLSDATVATTGLSIEQCDGAMVTGNTFRLNNSSQRSIYVDDTTDYVISGNYLDYQVVEDGASDYGSIAHNRWRNVGTTPLTIVGANTTATDNLPAPERRQGGALATAFTTPSSAAAQNVTGVAVALQAGTYRVTAYLPGHQTAGTGTMKIAWTFSGTISAASAKWIVTQGTAQVIGTFTSVTTQTASSSALSSGSVYLAEYTADVTVTATGTLQLQTQASATGTQVQFPPGSYVRAERLV